MPAGLLPESQHTTSAPAVMILPDKRPSKSLDSGDSERSIDSIISCSPSLETSRTAIQQGRVLAMSTFRSSGDGVVPCMD